MWSDLQLNIFYEALPYLVQLYRYSLKLEDSDDTHEQPSDYSYSHMSTNGSGDASCSKNVSQTTNMRKYFPEPNGIEVAIAHAASDFILSGVRNGYDRGVNMTIPPVSVGSDFIHIFFAKLMIAELVFRYPNDGICDRRRAWKLLSLLSALLSDDISISLAHTSRLRYLLDTVSLEDIIRGLHVGMNNTDHRITTKTDVVEFVRNLHALSLSFLSLKEMASINKFSAILLSNNKVVKDTNVIAIPLLLLYSATIKGTFWTSSKDAIITDIGRKLGLC
jgi:hypothetical protein